MDLDAKSDSDNAGLRLENAGQPGRDLGAAAAREIDGEERRGALKRHGSVLGRACL